MKNMIPVLDGETEWEEGWLSRAPESAFDTHFHQKALFYWADF